MLMNTYKKVNSHHYCSVGINTNIKDNTVPIYNPTDISGRSSRNQKINMYATLDSASVYNKSGM